MKMWQKCLRTRANFLWQNFFDDVSNFFRPCTQPANFICWCCCHPAAGSRNDSLSLEEEGGTPYKMVVKLAARADFCQIFFDGFVHERIFGKWFDEKLCMLAFVKFSLTNENVAKVPSYTNKFSLTNDICQRKFARVRGALHSYQVDWYWRNTQYIYIGRIVHSMHHINTDNRINLQLVRQMAKFDIFFATISLNFLLPLII